MSAAWPWLVQLAVVAGLALPLGWWVARVMDGRTGLPGRWLAPLEKGIYRLLGVDPAQEMSWQRYGLALAGLHALGVLLLYLLQRFQGLAPLNPLGLPAVAPQLSLNTAVSFVTNTNWQSYGGETTLSHLVQAAGLTVQNFLSAAVGLAVAAALARGFRRSGMATLGNLWADLVRSMLYVLLPLSLLLSGLLLGQGVPQRWSGAVETPTLQAVAEGGDGVQRTPLGPVASQVAIKQLGSNGGGYYNANSAHPLENPTPLSNSLEWGAILLLPLACLFAWGSWLRRPAHAWTLLAAVLLVALPLGWLAMDQETRVRPERVDPGLSSQGPSWEGKELRFGPAASAAWAVATTATSNGSVNSMHDSFTPLGGMAAMLLMQIGEVAPGGAGSGLYGLIAFAVLAVFLAGLMVGRTPELLGKRLGAYEVRMAALMVLLPSLAVLGGTAAACLEPAARAAVANPGPHGFSELLYAFSSASNNNGSAFAGLSANQPFLNLALAACMAVGRLGVILPALALAGALAARPCTPESPGTLPSSGGLFAVLLAGTIVLVGALTFLPALALGPIVEHVQWLS